MTATDTILDRLAAGTADEAGDRARAWLADHGFPHARDEAWRYTPVDEILATLAGAVAAAGPVADLDRSIVDDLAGDHGGRRIVFVNGVHVPQLSDDRPLPPGFYLGPLADASGMPAMLGAAGGDPLDGFDALNRLAGSEAAVVAAPPGARLDLPLHVVHLGAPGAGTTAVHPRTIVHAASGSRITVIETYAGSPGAQVTNASSTVHVGDGAVVAYQRIQEEAPGVTHLGRTRIRQAAGSELRAVSVMTGADIARLTLDVVLDGREAVTRLDGLYLPRGRQRHDHVVTVDHAASNCTSRQRFKGIVDGRARGSFGGRIIVRSGTVATDADQTNHNLLLCRSAQADTRPWLEIFADDVRCTHGGSIGRLDDDALFYLRSRGVPLAEARAMLVTAFADEIIARIIPESLRNRIAATVQANGVRG
jgi:Fe-S cluster assembly protein SufD